MTKEQQQKIYRESFKAFIRPSVDLDKIFENYYIGLFTSWK